MVRKCRNRHVAETTAIHLPTGLKQHKVQNSFLGKKNTILLTTSSSVTSFHFHVSLLTTSSSAESTWNDLECVKASGSIVEPEALIDLPADFSRYAVGNNASLLRFLHVIRLKGIAVWSNSLASSPGRTDIAVTRGVSPCRPEPWQI